MSEDRTRMTLSVVMPAYNEARTIEASLQRLRAVPLDLEIIAIDDGSTDGTTEILRRLAERGVVDHLIVQDRNRGKGAAVRAGIAAATGGAVVVQDADLEYDPVQLPRLLEPIEQNVADAVFGSRFLGSPRRVLYFWHRVGNGFLTLVSNMFTDLNLTDMETCYKMMRTDVAQRLPLRACRFGIEPEVTARLAQAGARIYEVPISYHGRTYIEGKKINWRDGVAAFWHILRFNLLPPRPDPLPATPAAPALPKTTAAPAASVDPGRG
ncbi:MAG TPA: glycosyltransferase family 2 protein [Longimicrobiales bacterium]|nr:glycosyltransferase family 2 protein [Longimicrobiales bacterium]